MKRREFIAGLAGAVAWPIAARAQQPERVQVGRNSHGDHRQRRSAIADNSVPTSFIKNWAEIEGRTVQVDLRWGGHSPESIATQARELTQLKPASSSSSGPTSRVDPCCNKRRVTILSSS